MKQVFKKIHLWLSLPFGIIISIISFSGAALVFEKEITTFVHHHSSPEVHGSTSTVSIQEFFRTMRKVHRWLMDAPRAKGEKTTGKIIVGVSTLSMVFILVSGMALWIPHTKRMLKNRITVSVHKGRRRFLYDCHVVIGIYVSVFLLIMALTGLTWSFHWYRNIAYSLFEGGGIRHLFYSIHTGAWGGIVTKVIYFLSALAGGTLPITGYYLWLKKK